MPITAMVLLATYGLPNPPPLLPNVIPPKNEVNEKVGPGNACCNAKPDKNSELVR